MAEVQPRPSADAADVDLIRRIAAGDRAAFEQLYVGYHRRLSRFLMRFAHRYDVAEEIINDTLYVVWKKAGEFRGSSRVSTWIIGIAYRRALKSYKHLDVLCHAEAQACEDQEHAGEAVARQPSHEAADWLAHGLRQLSVEQRLVLELAYYLGHSCEEIAQIMECPVNTVKTRMFAARRRLREVLPQLAEPVLSESARHES